MSRVDTPMNQPRPTFTSHFTLSPQAGRPKSISGFQTHTTPVLLGANERAELATDKYIALSPILEGQVILRLNPDYIETD